MDSVSEILADGPLPHRWLHEYVGEGSFSEPPPVVSAERRFLELLPTIDSLSAAACRRRGLSPMEAEDFAADVRARFVESDYAPLRQFRGESSVTTYLAVVIASWMRDYIVARDGRWRPSAAALRAGPVAVHLERLVSKGGRARDEAIAEVLAGGDQPYSEAELRALLRTLPHRDPMRPRPDSPDRIDGVAGAPSMRADSKVEQEERDTDVGRARAALERAIDTLGANDRLLVSMRFLDGLSVADIARTLRVEQKPLYRRLERSLALLRRTLESSGLTQEVVRDLVSGGDS
jgi:RNA polymerase sigma factor (sigma-70 family)